MRIVFATGNKDKMREIRQILGGLDAEVQEIRLESEVELHIDHIVVVLS